MADDSASNLVDISYQTLHGMLSGQIEGSTADKILMSLQLRADRFRKCVAPFGQPSAASRAKVESGTVTLDDGAKIKVEAADKPFVWAVSKRFMLDEVDALVLLRSFLYNQGLPDGTAANAADDLAEAISSFYFAERLSVLRCFIPLFRAKEAVTDPLHDVATAFLTDVITDGPAFVTSLLNEYIRRTKQQLTPEIMRNTALATSWAKQIAREQLVMVELLFWTLWEYIPSTSTTTVAIFRAAYETDLGRTQLHAALLLEEEGRQILNDLESLWTVLLVETLRLEQVLDEDIDMTAISNSASILLAAPQQLEVIHGLVLDAQHAVPRYAPIVLAWCAVLFRVHQMLDSLDTIPEAYENFVNATSTVPGSDPPQPLYQQMLMWTLHEDVDILGRLHGLLTTSPLFVTALAWSSGSSLTDPNAIAFRAVVKGLVIALCEMCRAEFIPDFPALVDVWVALFGTGELASTAPLSLQYWSGDWSRYDRRQPFDVARVRFPVRFRPLVRMLGAMARSSAGALYVFHFFNELPSFTHVVPLDDRFNRTYEADPDSDCWTNIVPLRLPGGSLVAPGSTARIMSGDTTAGAPIVLKWDHSYSGWGLLRAVLADCAHMRANIAAGRKIQTTRSAAGTITVKDIGIELGPGEEDSLVVDGLELIHNIIKHERELVPLLVTALEAEDDSFAAGLAPNLVQMVILMLEDSLRRAEPNNSPASPNKLITTCLELLTALLPFYPDRVWPYLKTTTQLFGNELAQNSLGATPALLAAERVSGTYGMTRALIALVRAMIDDTLPLVGANGEPGPPVLRELKEKVLVRALRLLHAEVWLEHAGWRFRELGERFEIARRVVGLYSDVVRGGAGTLQSAIVGMFLANATNASISPIVTPLVAGTQLLGALYKTRRFAEARELVVLVEALLRFARLVLARKGDAGAATLLEHTFFASGTGRTVPVDAVAALVATREFGPRVPAEAVALLTALTSSVALLATPLALARHLSDPVGTAEAMVRIARHPYDDPALRIAVWRFIGVAVASQPAFAGIFVAGTFSAPPKPDSEKKKDASPPPNPSPPESNQAAGRKLNALEAARQIIRSWKTLWEGNPELLATTLAFVEAVWNQALEHKAALEATRSDPQFAQMLTEIALAEAGATPNWETSTLTEGEGGSFRSDVHALATDHAHRLVAKTKALSILALDVNVDPPSAAALVKGKATETHSLVQLLDIFGDEKTLRSNLVQAMTNSFDPALVSALFDDLHTAYPAVTLERVPYKEQSREFGDEYVYDIALLRTRLAQVLGGPDVLERARAQTAILRACAVNLNWSIADAEIGLTQAWRRVLRSIARVLSMDAKALATLLATAAELAADATMERRAGSVMAAVHAERLHVILSMLEMVWFSNDNAPTDSDKDKDALALLLSNVETLVTSETFPPSEPLRRKELPQYHTPLLQIIYVCVRKTRALRGKIKTEHRLTFKSAFTASVVFVIDGLGSVFSLLGGEVDPGALAQDTALLVAIFEQCIRPEIELWSQFWLNRCQQANLFPVSLQIFARSNLTGTTEETVFARHILALQLALAGVPAAADRLANDGAIAAYCSNTLSTQVSIGNVDAGIERSPAHWLWCSVIGVVTAILSHPAASSGRVAEDAIGFVQVCGAQLDRALSWQVEQPITMAFVEELELVIGFFYAFASVHDERFRGEPAVAVSARVVLRSYAQRALLLLQHLNYALTHRMHLESLVELAPGVEKTKLWKDDLLGRFMIMTSNVVSTLSVLTACDAVFLKRPNEWPVDNNVFIVANINKTHRAPASFGTLFETVNCALDIVRAASAGTSYPVVVVDASQRTAENVLTFASGQLAMWVVRRELDSECIPGETLRELRSDLVELLGNVRKGVEPRSKETATYMTGLTRFVSGLTS